MTRSSMPTADPILSPRRLFGRILPLRHLPVGRISVLPGLTVPAPVGPIRAAADDPVLGRIGALEVRLARTVGDVKRAQALRYRVFYEERGAVADARALLTRRDSDGYDPHCDHVLVVDHDNPSPRPFGRRVPRIVGTCRLLRQDMAARCDGFYTAGEFDLAPLLDRKRGLAFLELGRSCVLPAYRTKRTAELLWHGVWAYVLRHRMDVMIGCASLEGIDPERLAVPLSFLHHHAAAPAEWRVAALPSRRVDMDRLPKDAVDPKAALKALPPLVKGYLRLGAMIGDGAVVDHQFGTTDVCMILPVSSISARYVSYYGADAGRRAA